MPQPVVHFEIGCRDLPSTRAFYEAAFDWNIANDQTHPAGGIPGHFTSLGHEPHQYVSFYIQVDDVAAALEKVVLCGGKKVVGPLQIPTGTFAWFSDPGGNMLGLWRPAPAG